MFEHEDLDTSDDEGEFRKSIGEKKCELIAEELREIKAQRMEKAADKKERKQKRKMEKAQEGECLQNTVYVVSELTVTWVKIWIGLSWPEIKDLLV